RLMRVRLPPPAHPFPNLGASHSQPTCLARRHQNPRALGVRRSVGRPSTHRTSPREEIILPCVRIATDGGKSSTLSHLLDRSPSTSLQFYRLEFYLYKQAELHHVDAKSTQMSAL